MEVELDTTPIQKLKDQLAEEQKLGAVGSKTTIVDRKHIFYTISTSFMTHESDRR